MAHITPDRVREFSQSTGTGNFTLSGPVTSFRSFASVATVNDTFFYTIASISSNEWEVGIGTYVSANTFTRTTVISSSNFNSTVNFSGGDKDVFITAPGSKFLQQDNTGSYGDFSANSLTADAIYVTGAEGNLAPESGIGSWYSTASVSVSAQETEPRDLSFSSDGTKMYILGNAGDDITQYTLSTAWNITTIGSPVTFSVATQDTTPQGLYFKPDGTGFYVTGAGDGVHQYTLSAAWDISTSSFTRTFSVTSQETDPQAIYFKSDGTKMYVIGTTGDDVNEYNLSTAWDISTAVYSTVYSISAYETSPQGLSFNADGTKFWVVGPTYTRIAEFSMSTPWSISSATFVDYVNLFYIQPDSTNLYTLAGVSGLYVNEAIGKAWITDYNTDRIFELKTNGTTTKFTGNTLSIDSQLFTVKNNLIVNRNIKANGELRVIGSAYLGATYSAIFNAQSATSTLSLGTSTTTAALNVGTGLTTGALTVGGTAATGAMTFGQSTGTQTLNLATGATASGSAKTVNIATNAVSGSTTAITIGSTNGTTVTANGTWTFPVTIEGNAATATNATKLQTARNINGISFDGSADITVTATTPNTLTLGVSGTGLSGSATFNGSSASTFTVTSNATSANTASTIVARDSNGDFSARNITSTILYSGGATIRGWTATDTDIDSLIPGSTTGTLIQGTSNAHVVVGIQGNDSSDGFYIIDTNNTAAPAAYSQLVLAVTNSTFQYKGNTIWHAGNDGSGSGLDADLLDGKNIGTSGNTIPLLDGANTWSQLQIFSNNATGNSSSLSSRFVTNDGTNHGVWIAPKMAAGSYNPITVGGDSGLFFSSGSQGTGSLVIAPWSGSSSGLRMDSSGNTSLTGTLTTSGILSSPAGIKNGVMAYPIWEGNLDFGSAAAGTWNKIIGASLVNNTYSTIGFKIEITDPNANHGTQGSVAVDQYVYYVACVRTEALTLDTPDLCVVKGPSDHIRAIKTAVGVYEIHLKNEAQYREYYVKITPYALNLTGHTIQYFNLAAVGTATATYSASAGTDNTYFANVYPTGNFHVTIGDSSSARFARNSSQYYEIVGGASPSFTSYSASNNAKPLTFHSTTDVSNTAPTSGTVGFNFNVLGTTRLTVDTAATTVAGVLKVNGTTQTAGSFYAGTTNPTGTTRLNYDGYFYPTYINLIGSGETATAATHYFVETGSDGYVRPKTLANVKTEIVTTAAVNAAAATTVGTVTSGTWNATAITDTYLATISSSGKVSNSATTATSANTASAIVARDASGNFSAGTITATLSGNASGTSINGSYIGVNNTINTNGYGLSLYNGAVAGQPTYGMMFQGTATFGTHGGVTGDWTTYLTMNNSSGRGWIFRDVSTPANVASITNTGLATFNNSVRSPIFYDSNNTAYYIDPASTSNLYNVNIQGELFAGNPTFGGFPLAPNLVHNSYMNRVTGSVPDGYSVLGNITIEAVSPWTKAFEGPYTPSAPVGAVSDPELATEANPYWFGVYTKGPRIERGGMRDGWHSFSDGKLLKVTGTGITSGQHCAIYLPKELNNLGAKWIFSAFVKITKGSSFAVGSDAGYLLNAPNAISKSTTDAGPQGWVRYTTMIGTSQITSIDGLAISIAILPDANGDIEGYIALPYLANVNYKGTNLDSWSGSVIDKFEREGVYIKPGTGGYTDIGGAGSTHRLNVSGTTYSSSDFRSPIFYDSNDTGYYVDPNSTSNMSAINVAGALVRIGKTHSEGGEIRFLNTASTAGGYIQGWDTGIRTVDHNWSTTTWSIDNAGNSIAVASHRAPIFYDSSDTGYFWNPNTSSAHRLQTPSGYLDLGPMNTSHCHFQTDRATFYFGSKTLHDGGISAYNSDDYAYFPVYYDYNDTGYYVDPNSTSILYRTSTYLAGKDTNSDWAAGFRNTPTSSKNFHGDISSGGPSGTWWFYESMRHSNGSNYWGTQIAYGWEDNANEIYQRNITSNNFSGWVRYVNTNNATSIYPRINGTHLMYYEGFTLDANTMSTNSTGFTYSVNAPATGPIARFGTGGGYDLWLNASYGNGNTLYFRTRQGDAGTMNSWRAAVSYGVNYSDSIYGTIFYDANDTGYYCDPNSGSQFSAVYANNWLRPQGGSGLYFQDYGRGIRAADNEYSYGNTGTYGDGLNGWRGYGIYPNNAILMANGSTVGIHNPQWGWIFQSDMNGNVTWGGNVTAYSDLRLKENVREIDNVIERRNTLAKSAIKYERDGRTRIGYGAQILQENGCGEFVLEADDSLKLTTGLGTLSVDYGETAAVLAVASKMTDDRVKVLEDKIERLESLLINIMEKLNAN